MNLEFTNTIPDNINLQPILISEATSINYKHQIFIVEYNNKIATSLYQIKYQIHSSSFKEVMKIKNILAVGHEEYFYLYNTTTNTNILSLTMNGYFGHLYYNTKIFYVTDATGIYCINKTGNIIWHNDELGIDGVIINDFIDNTIVGNGDFDPPGGWIDFSINKETGIKIL
ncbi:MAG: hypothetical protein JSR09_04230 [Bacteroidetes bacterium]|nr:hypothetical protein [Bacteroidota bacterium]MBS1648894.1 hypothetical protein [Bacteroidota bacterium]